MLFPLLMEGRAAIMFHGYQRPAQRGFWLPLMRRPDARGLTWPTFLLSAAREKIAVEG